MTMCSLLLPLRGTWAPTPPPSRCLGLSRAAPVPPMWTWKMHAMISPQDGAWGLQGGSLGHMHYQVNYSLLVFAQCKPLSKHVETSYLYSIEPLMHDLAILEYRA